MDVKISNIPVAPRHTLPRVGWSVGKTARYNAISDRSHVYTIFYYFNAYFISCLKKSWESLLRIAGCCGSHPTILNTVLDSSCYLAPAFSFVFNFVSKWRRNERKGGFWRSFGLSFDVITNRTKLKNNTPNALSSPYVDAIFFFRESEISWDIFHLAENDWFWPILTDFCQPFFFFMDSPVILEFSVKYFFFSCSVSSPDVLAVTNMVVPSEKMFFSWVMTINAIVL